MHKGNQSCEYSTHRNSYVDIWFGVVWIPFSFEVKYHLIYNLYFIQVDVLCSMFYLHYLIENCCLNCFHGLHKSSVPQTYSLEILVFQYKLYENNLF